MSATGEPGPDASAAEWLDWFSREAIKQTAAATAKPAAKQTPAEANRVIQAKDFIGDLKPRPWRVKGLQPLDAQVCMIFGDSQDGKSFFMADVLGCVHRGVPWNGHPVVRGRVVALVAEGSGDFRYRHEVYRQANKLTHADLFPIIDNAPDLLDAKQAAAVVGQIQAAGGCDVLLVDTLSATFSGDENGSDMNCYLRNVKLMQRALGCCVWIISHTGKSRDKGQRGWSGQKATADVQLEITREDDVRTVAVVKAKGFSEGAAFHFKLPFVALGKDADGQAYGSCKVEYVKEAGPKRVKLTQTQRDAKALLTKMAPTGTVDYERLIAAIIKDKGYTENEVQGHHKRDARKTVEQLCKLGQAYMHGADRVSLASSLIQSEEGWLDGKG